MSTITCSIKQYIQPFERHLALTELKKLARAVPQPVNDGNAKPAVYKVVTNVSPAYLAERLVYWETIGGRTTYHTHQVRKEATMAVAQNGVALKDMENFFNGGSDISLPRRRCLRYGPHGLHEYRGKFFPQLVASLFNSIDLKQSALTMDPMCGSGTSLVESTLAGYKTYGLDMNPLSVFMSKVKCALLTESPASFLEGLNRIRRQIEKRRRSPFAHAKIFIDQLKPGDKEYLERWFDKRILLDLASIRVYIGELENQTVRNLALLSLSNILRPLSWQKNDDLRVRRELWDTSSVDARVQFLREFERAVRLTVSFLYEISGQKLGSPSIKHGDARKLSKQWRQFVNKVDAVVTSPPYATALPYLDTDRLSLTFLGLLSREEHRKHDVLMIGNREVTRRLRNEYWNRFLANKKTLPRSISCLITQLNDLNNDAEVGFRRKNLPSLLAKYFFDMREVLCEVKVCLKRGGHAFFVIGVNHTIAGGNRVDIKTANLLGELAESVGLSLTEKLSMEMLVSRDIFRDNASTSETILHLRKTS
jgi:site-specific DNA-methyltransferase (cytosine-N4-specific)